MLPDGSRRRTTGGLFFHLAFTTGVPKEGRSLRLSYMKKKKEKDQEESLSSPSPLAQKQQPYTYQVSGGGCGMAATAGAIPATVPKNVLIP